MFHIKETNISSVLTLNYNYYSLFRQSIHIYRYMHRFDKIPMISLLTTSKCVSSCHIAKCKICKNTKVLRIKYICKLNIESFVFVFHTDIGVTRISSDLTDPCWHDGQKKLRHSVGRW